MSDEDRARYNARYRVRHAEGVHEAAPLPDPFVVRALEALALAPGDRALDLACGTGRHALELGRRGLAVEAWDISDVALELLDERARQRGLSITTRQVDLDSPRVTQPFDCVVIVDYLDRGLLARARSMLATTGVLIVCTFTDDWPGTHPSARFRLRRGELLRLFDGAQVALHSEQGGRAGLAVRWPERG